MFGNKSRRARRAAVPELVPVDIAALTATILATDPAVCDEFDTGDRARLLTRLADLDRLKAALDGEVNRTIAALAPRKARKLRSEQAVIDEICTARRVGAWTAQRMLSTARLCAGPGAPAAGLQEALACGAVSGAHVDKFVKATESVVDDVLSPTEVEQGASACTRGEKLAAIARGAMRSARLDTPAQYGRVLDAAVARVDGPATAERRRVALASRDLFASRRLDDPIAALILRQSPENVARVMRSVQRAARRLQLSRGGARAAHADPDARISACRADTFLDAILRGLDDEPDLPEGCETGPLPDGALVDLPDPRTGLREPAREGFLVIDVATLRGERDNPCLLDGTPVPACVGRAAAAGVARWRRMVTDPVTGVLLDYGTATYLPSALTDFVRHRDGQCIVPFCERPAMACQVDHGIAHPKGPSSATNCNLLCDRHHPLKTDGYEHLDIDLDTGHVTYRTAWGQMLQACGHPFLPDWDDEPYDVLTQTRPHPPGNRDHAGDVDVGDDAPTYWDRYDLRPPAQPALGPQDRREPDPPPRVDPGDDPPPF